MLEETAHIVRVDGREIAFGVIVEHDTAASPRIDDSAQAHLAASPECSAAGQARWKPCVEAWKAMGAPYEVEPSTPVGDGILQIRLPMTGNPLRYINSYLVADEGGYALIDCGWRSSDVMETLQSVLWSVGVKIQQIRRVVATHFHHDHYGLAATLQREGVPELLMHPADWEFICGHLGDPEADTRRSEWLDRNGFGTQTLADDDLRRERSEIAQPTTLIEDGQRIGRLLVLWTPGHTPGHVCLYDTQSNRVFTGDCVLDPITPHVGVWGPGRGDPLGSYLDALRELRGLPSRGALPAHGEPFEDLPGRIGGLLRHHSERERQVLSALCRAPRTAALVARSLLWTRRRLPFSDLSESHQRFAVAETIAHLEHLRAWQVVSGDPASRRITYAIGR